MLWLLWWLIQHGRDIRGLVCGGSAQLPKDGLDGRSVNACFRHHGFIVYPIKVAILIHLRPRLLHQSQICRLGKSSGSNKSAFVLREHHSHPLPLSLVWWSPLSQGKISAFWPLGWLTIAGIPLVAFICSFSKFSLAPVPRTYDFCCKYY